MALLGCFVAQTRGAMFYYQTSNYATERDIVVFAKEPGNPFDPISVIYICV